MRKYLTFAGVGLLGLIAAFKASASTNVAGTVRNLNRNPLSNVEVTVQNGVTLRDTTDVNGNYSISNVPDGNNASIYLIPLSNANWCARQDSLNLAGGTLDFPAVLPDTFFVNSDSSNSVARVRTNELRNVEGIFGPPGKNPWLWNRKDIPYFISDRFGTSDSTSIETAIRWANASLDTNNLIKYVWGSDSTRSIFFRPGTLNWTNTFVSGDSIYRSVIELNSSPFVITTLHEMLLHATNYPSAHVNTYTPSNFSSPTSVMPQPKDKAYVSMGYLLRKTQKDGINKLNLIDYADSLTVGVEINPQLTAPVRNEGLIVYLPRPNPVKDVAHIKYFIDKPQINEISLYNASGQLIRKEIRPDGAGEHEFNLDLRSSPNGIYFLRIRNGEGSKTGRIVKINY